MQQAKKPRIQTRKKSYALHDSPLYKLRSKKKLAGLLNSTIAELLQFRNQNDQSHYHCFVDYSHGKPRDIQAPRQSLDRVQTKVASLLCRITPPDFLHSGIKGRSHVTNARAHTGMKRMLVTDLRAFYTSTPRIAIFNLFYNTFKCAPDVADLLSHVLTYNDHIPTGSRVSMPLAYWANKPMFNEMLNTARARNITMTVYVDDLTFSGTKVNTGFKTKMEQISTKYGHQLHPQKTHILSTKATKMVTGAVIQRGKVTARNKHLKLLHSDLNDVIENNGYVDENTYNRISGRMNSLASLDPRFKDKARSFRRTHHPTQ